MKLGGSPIFDTSLSPLGGFRPPGWIVKRKKESVFANGSLLEAETRNDKQTVRGSVSFTRRLIIWFVFDAVAESFPEHWTPPTRFCSEGDTSTALIYTPINFTFSLPQYNKMNCTVNKKRFLINHICVTKVISSFFKLRIFLLVNVCLNYIKKKCFFSMYK